jgi:hypothetical protein
MTPHCLRRSSRYVTAAQKRFFDLDPIPATPACVQAAESLRHDSFEAQLAGVIEYDRAVPPDRFSEGDPVSVGDERL